MKIFYDPKIFYLQKFGGISRYFINLANEISKSHDVRLIAPISLNNYLDLNTSVKKINFLRLKKHYKNTRYLSNYLNENFFKFYSNIYSPDIIHLTYYEKKLYFKKKTKIVLTVFDLIHEKFKNDFDFGYKDFYKKDYLDHADKIICISESCKSDLLEFYDVEKDKIHVIHLGVDLSRKFRVINDNFLDKPFILFVGNRKNYKNFEGFIKAFSLSKNLVKNFNIVCFGEEVLDNKELELLKKCNINQSKIKIYSGDDLLLNFIYKKASAYVCPSLYEGFGLTLLEAMSMNCPVISSNAGSLKEVGGDLVDYFDPSNMEEMSFVIEKFVFSDEKIKSQKSRIGEHLKKFDWRDTAKKTINVYEKITE